VLERVLAAVASGTAVPAAVVLADQGEEPERVAAWARPLADAGVEVVHLRFPPAGPAAARNRAIARVSTPLLAGVDDDCVPAGDWLERLAHRLHRHPGAVVTGRVDAPAGGRAASTIETASERIHRRPVVKVDPLYTGNFGVAVEVARRIGPFDERLPCAEDNDWAHRALSRGVPIVYAPEVAVTHHDHRDAAALAELEARYARGQGTFYGKHLRRGDLRIALRVARDLARAPWRWLRGRVTGDAAAAASGRAWLRHLPAGLVAGLRLKRREER
jgi:GT2 family glycosyltransferase